MNLKKSPIELLIKTRIEIKRFIPYFLYIYIIFAGSKEIAEYHFEFNDLGELKSFYGIHKRKTSSFYCLSLKLKECKIGLSILK